MSSLLSSANIITHFPVIWEREKSVSVLSWRVELELESGIGDLSWSFELELETGTTDLHGQGFAYARPFKGQIHEYSEIDLAARPRANSKQKDCMFIGILRPKRR